MKEIEIENQKIADCVLALEKVLQDQKMTVAELLLTYGNLGYKLGANLRQTIFDKDFVSEPPNVLYCSNF